MGADSGLPKLERAIDTSSRTRFAEVVGRRIALLGSEDGVFECWIWPLKIAHDVALAFRTANGERIEARGIATRIEIDPFELRLEYAGPNFRAKTTIFAALDRRALVWLFEIECASTLSIEISLTPDFRPMWPAGIGGQIAFADEASGAFALTEELGRFAALFASPEAEPISIDADHALPRDALTISIPVSPTRAERGPIPFFVVGAEVEPKALSSAAKIGEEGAASGHSRAHEVLSRARALYREALTDWPNWRDEQIAHWRRFLARTTTFRSGDEAHDSAFLWAKIAIERAWVEVDGIGRGLVAGLAPSGSSERPGFGWFFDGDAMVAARAMSLYGDFEGAQRVLEFAASHQRADGKLMHELVLSARLCNWIDDYPYAYYKGVNTPDFLGTLRAHLAASGDRELLDRLWPNVERAFRHGLSCLDERGLYSVRKAGLAAVEAGPLVGRIESEIFAHGLWNEALNATFRFAVQREDSKFAGEVVVEFARMAHAFDEFWNPPRNSFAFARLVDGSLWPDVTAYHGLGLQLETIAFANHPERRSSTAKLLNEPKLAADWGLRMFPNDSEIYRAEHYNSGSVFPYLTNFAILALFECGQTSAALQILRSQVLLSGFSGLGFVPEHLVGDRALAPSRGVPHQIFSSSCIIQSTLRGALGIDQNALKLGVMTPELTLRPVCANTGDVELAGLRIDGRVIDVKLARRSFDGSTRLEARFELRSGAPIEVGFAPRTAPLTRIESLATDGRPSEHLMATLSAACTFQVVLREGPTLVHRANSIEPGSASCHPRIIESSHDERSVTWTVWGLAGRTERLELLGDRVVRVSGARVSDSIDQPRAIDVEFGAGDGFVRQVVRAELAE